MKRFNSFNTGNLPSLLDDGLVYLFRNLIGPFHRYRGKREKNSR